MKEQLNKKKKTKFIFTVAVTGGVGKSLSASLIVETLRLSMNNGIKTVAITCDPDHQDLNERYGLRDSYGALIEEQDIYEGVQFIDFSNPEIRENQFKKLFSYDADYVVVDFGAGQVSSFDQLFGNIDKFKQFIRFARLDITFVCPVKDEKTFTEFNNLSNLFGNSVNFVLAFNEGLLKATKTISTESKKELTSKINALDVDKFVIKETLTETIISGLAKNPFRKLYTPRIERQSVDEDGDIVYTSNDDDYILQDMNDQFILDNVLTLTTHQINGLFGLPQPYKDTIEGEMDNF